MRGISRRQALFLLHAGAVISPKQIRPRTARSRLVQGHFACLRLPLRAGHAAHAGVVRRAVAQGRNGVRAGLPAVVLAVGGDAALDHLMAGHARAIAVDGLLVLEEVHLRPQILQGRVAFPAAGEVHRGGQHLADMLHIALQLQGRREGTLAHHLLVGLHDNHHKNR